MISRPPAFSRTGLFLAATVAGMIFFAALYRLFSR